MARLISLAEAISENVHDGDTIAMEGFTHLIPYAAGHEVIRQGKKDLFLIRMTPDILYDQLIGAGAARGMKFSWGGNPGVGSLHRFRDAVENQWPRPLEIEEHSHAAMANAYEAGAANLPFAMLRGYIGADLTKVNPNIRQVTCPFTGEVLAAVPAIRPDVTIIHALRADRRGNVLIEGIVGVQKEAVQRADARIAAPGEFHSARRTGTNQLVVENIRRHADQKQILFALPDHFMTGGIGNQVGEPLHGDGVAVMHVFGNGFSQRNQSRQGILLLICHHNWRK